MTDPEARLHAIAQAIYDKKGSNILALDLRGITGLTDYVIIAEGNVDRHVVAIASHVEQTLGKMGESPAYMEGMESGEWVVIDYIDVMVHIFIPSLRERYRLEELWRKGKIVDLKINLQAEV